MKDNSQPRKITRRQLLTLAGASVGVLGLAAACSPAAPAATPAPTKAPEAPKPASTTAPAAPAATQAPAATTAPAATQPAAKKGGTFRFAHTGDAPDLDPHKLTFQKFCIIPQVYDTLVLVDENRKAQPMLAESWQYAPDGSYVDFKLRKSVKFHSGKEMTSEDIAYNIERIQDPTTGGAQLTTILKNVKAQVIDPLTLRINLPAPTPALLDAFHQMYILEKGAKLADVANKGNGTGPFKLLEWRPNDIARFARNEAYWKPGKPQVDALEIKIIPDAGAMLVNLEAGALDGAEAIPNQDHARLRQNNQIKLIISQYPATTYDTLFNVTTPPFNDKRVRQAFSYAANRQRFVDNILFGVGTPKSIPWPTISMAYDAELDKRYTTFSLDKAKALLDQAGQANGFDCQMITTTSGWPELAKFAQMFQADLAQIGVRLKLEDMDSTRWNDLLVNAKFPQLITHAFGYAQKDPSLLFAAYPFQPTTGVTGYRSDNYTQLVSQAAAEKDADKRKTLYKQITELMIDEQWAMVLTPAFRSWAFRSIVTGFKATLDDMEMFEDISL